MQDHLRPEKLLLQYLDALDSGDTDTLHTIWQLAENDSQLNRLIVEIHDALDAESPGTSVQPVAVYNHNHREEPSMISLTRGNTHAGVPSSWNQGLLITAAAAIAVALFLGIIFVQPRAIPTALSSSVQQPMPDKLEIFERYINDVWNTGDLTTLEEIMPGSHEYIEANNTDRYFTRDMTAGRINSLRESFKDFHFRIDETIVDDNRVWASLTLTMSKIRLDEQIYLQPTVDPLFTVPTTMILRFEGNLIDETWVSFNYTDAFWQLFAAMEVDPEALMREAQNKDIAKLVIDSLWNGKDLEAASDFYADEVKFWFGWLEPDVLGSTGMVDDYVRPLRTAFPDLQMTVNATTVDGDQVIVQYSAIGTFSNDLCGDCEGEPITATGENIAWTGVIMYRLEDGKISEERWYLDFGFIHLFIEPLYESLQETE